MMAILCWRYFTDDSLMPILEDSLRYFIGDSRMETPSKILFWRFYDENSLLTIF